MASASGSGGAIAAPPASPLGGGAAAGGGAMGPEASLTERWDSLQVAESSARAERVSAVLAARFPEEFTVPALPAEAWSVIMDRAASCRCAGGAP